MPDSERWFKFVGMAVYRSITRVAPAGIIPSWVIPGLLMISH
ncbi:uncharacterized protein METZ01_LOCUS385658 [marine metagenome]|uniref:Uncharacterized protein n=1 Tax=marine metagenome TaxID=408172 RepID=A0A382UET8_9ZZZZ